MSFSNQQPWAGVAGAPDGVVVVRTMNLITIIQGSPHGVLAGQSGSASVPPDIVWDWVNKCLWVCTGSSADPTTAIWEEIAFVGGNP